MDHFEELQALRRELEQANRDKEALLAAAVK